MFTNANDNGQNNNTADVINNANGTTADGQSINNANDDNNDGSKMPVSCDPSKVGTTPELRDGNGIICPERPLTREELNDRLADDLATCKYFVRIYTEQLAETIDDLATITTRDRLTFWQNEREQLNKQLAELTDDERQTVGQLFTSKIEVLNGNDPDDMKNNDKKSAVFAYNNAKKRVDDKKSAVKTANDEATAARNNATKLRNDLNKEQLSTARLAVQSGNANENDFSLLAVNDVINNAADVLSSVASKLFPKRANGNKLLKKATDKIRSLSKICKEVAKNMADFVPFFEYYEVNVTKDDFTPNIVKSENVHPFMLVPTVDGLRVCDPVSVGRTLSPLTRWDEDKLCKVIVLNHYMKLENVSTDRLNLHVLLLSAAVDALQRARDKKNYVNLTNAKIKDLNDRLAELADPNKTPDNKFNIKLFVQLTNELADEKAILRAQLAEQRAAEKLADEKKNEVLADKKSDDVKNTINNARNERDNANGQTDVQTVDQTPTTANGTKKNGTKKNGTKSKKNGQTASRTRTTAKRTKKNDTKSDGQTVVLADGTNG